MRRIALAIAAATLSIGATGVSFAQDILRSLYSNRPVAYWSGVYVGANVGYGWARVSASATGGGTTVSASENLNGVVAGGQAGFNIQSGNLVWGLETDFQGTGQKSTTIATAGATTVTSTDKVPWFGTTRARVGFAAERWLAYVTGGVGYGQFKSDAVSTGAFTGTYSYSTTRAVWVVGAGVEALISNNFTWKLEYLHLDSGTISNSFTVGGTAVTTSAKFTDEILRFGVNYKFR